MPGAKEFYKSKTFWFNVLALVVMIANPLGFVDFAGDEHLAEYAAAVVTVINVILRFATSQPVVLKR
jgi:uncharacterized membrane protein